MASSSYQKDCQLAVRPSGNPPVTGFFALPTEIRNVIYELVFTKQKWKKGRKGCNTSALRTCRRMYEEAVPLVYSLSRFSIAIDPEILKHRGAPPLASQTTPLTNLSYIRKISFDLQVGQILVNEYQREVDFTHPEFEPQLQADIPEVQILLHRACMNLINSGAVLETFELFSCMIGQADLASHIDLLDCVKEVPVLNPPAFSGMKGPLSTEVAIYLEQLQRKMVSCTRKPGPGKIHAVTVEGMCKDIMGYTDACKRFIQASDMKRQKKNAACRKLDMAFLKSTNVATYPILADFAAEVNNSAVGGYDAKAIRLYFERGLNRLETEFLKLPRGKDGWRDVRVAREKLYVRKAFKEWGPTTVPNGLWCE